MKCKLCGREKPEYVVDPSCAKGGCCEWEEVAKPSAKTTYKKTASERELPRHHHSVNRLYNPVRRRMWLPLDTYGPIQNTFLVHAQPCVPFKPMGLMLWDLPPDAVVESFRVCNVEVVLAGSGPLFARIFARAGTYENLRKLVEETEDPIDEWFDAPALTPANCVTLHLSSKDYMFERTRAALWGLGLV